MVKDEAQQPLNDQQKAAINPVNPAAIPVAELARMLGLPEKTLRDHIDEGAPANPDGTMNLVSYAAWLNQPADSRDTHGH